MPRGKDFWNPYRMVPIRKDFDPDSRRRPPATHERFTGLSGVLHCTLENLTLLFVADHDDGGRFCDRLVDGATRLVIPGSSLKGACRSLAELIGGGCFSTNVAGDKDRYYILPDKYKACHKAHSLCITCRLFGMRERESDAHVHQGQVNISDALIREPQEAWDTQKCEILLMGPKPQHKAFYLTPTTNKFDVLSRKMYFHQPRRQDSVPEIPPNLRSKNEDKIRTIYPLRPGHHFDFQVSFTNLQGDELELLVYALALSNYEPDPITVTIEDGGSRLSGPMCHKIGHGKPLGMGSCAITINSMCYLPPPHRRLAVPPEAAPTTLSGDELRAEIRRLTRQFVHDLSPTMQHLRKMMVWDDSDDREFHYPDFFWFRTKDDKDDQGKYKPHPLNAQTPLKGI